MERKIARKMIKARREFEIFPGNHKYNHKYNYRYNNETINMKTRKSINKNKTNITKYRKENNNILKKIEGLSKLLLAGILMAAISIHSNTIHKHGVNEPEDYANYGGIQGKFNEMDVKGRIKNKIIDEAMIQGVDPNLALAIAETESHFNQTSKSSGGAIGIFQLMPDTAKSLGVDPYNEDDNIRGGITYIKKLLQLYGGDEKKALAAYNWGSGNLSRLGLENAPKETKQYIPKVLNAKIKFQQARRAQDLAIYNKVEQTGGKVGRYVLGYGVKISKPMKTYLSQTKGVGYITSGIRGNSYSPKSHTSGNKIDVAINNNQKDIIKTAVPFMLNPATVHISFECLGPAPRPFHSNSAKSQASIKSKQIADNIVKQIRSSYPEIDNRIRSGDLQVITNWGWMYGTGPHLDILIDPNKVKTELTTQNVDIEKYKSNIKAINESKSSKIKDNTSSSVSKVYDSSVKNHSEIKGIDKVHMQKGLMGKISPNQTYHNSNKKRFC